MSENQKYIDTKDIKSVLISIGFREEDANEQIDSLNQLIILSTAKKINEVYFPGHKVDPDSIALFIEENRENIEVANLIDSEISGILTGYFKTLAENLDPVKREEFLEKVGINQDQN